MFRKAIVVLALIAASALFLGAMPTPASAANCSGVGFWMTGPHNGAGSVGFKVQFGTCTDVDQVRVKYNVCTFFTCTLGNYRYYDGFYDGTAGTYIWAYLTFGGTNDVTMDYPGQPGVDPSPQGGVTVYRQCWYTGTHALGGHFWYQIHGATSHQWGGVYEYYPNVTYYVTC